MGNGLPFQAMTRITLFVPLVVNGNCCSRRRIRTPPYCGHRTHASSLMKPRPEILPFSTQPTSLAFAIGGWPKIRLIGWRQLLISKSSSGYDPDLKEIKLLPLPPTDDNRPPNQLQ